MKSLTARLAAVAFGLALSAASGAEGGTAAFADGQEGNEERPRPPTIFDLDYEVEDPEDLIPNDLEFQFRWRRIWGALGMRYHLYPAQRTGPNHGPPLNLYGGGVNYSIWRNPVTGWFEH